MSLTLLEFTNVETIADFFAQLEGQLELDYELGHNLDAVYDVLTSELDGPAELVWHNTDLARIHLGDWFVRILDVIHTAAADRGDLTVSLQ
ncbi:barstar family protein [Chitinimonas lacunae]|uniref:Barstar family protein n=1 Tax=Chitinimonas lacunae TaxID=1963018 RepID=A0ABV8MVK9_9NEIS